MQKDFRRMCSNLKKNKNKKITKKTRAHPSLRVSTCPNPKSSNPSRSIPHLLLLCAALGVLATPHLLSQTQRGGSKTTPLEDESYRLRWLRRREQHLNPESPRVLTLSLCVLLQLFGDIFLREYFKGILSKKIKIKKLKEVLAYFRSCRLCWCCWTLLFTL